jgi:beta-galactosidase
VNPTRRQFLCNSALAGASAALATSPLHASIARTLSSANIAVPAALTIHQLSAGWEHFLGALPNDNAWTANVPWVPVTLPHCFDAHNACDPDVPYYRGAGWYRTHLRISNPFPKGRTLLHFEAAGQDSTVYVGNTLIGMQRGGYNEFVYDITDAVAAQPDQTRIPVSVLCDNHHDDNRMPNDISDFTLYAGLYRHLNLVYVPAVSLEAAHMTYKLPDDKADFSTAAVSVTARLHNPSAATTPLQISVSISRLNGKLIQTKTQTLAPWKGEVELANITIPKPDLWSPDSPALYSCTVNIVSPSGVSTIHERFGVRRTELIDHGPFMLNNERLMLRGTQRHMDQCGFAGAEPDELVRKQFKLAKEMGINFIRLAHYQQSKLVLDLCDELGILVWEELIWCRSGIVSEQFKQMGRDKLAIMIDQHRNHPAVLFWGLGNEDDWPDEAGGLDKDASRAYMTELNDIAHKLDPSRFTSYRRGDYLRDIPDAYSPSIWAGWYSGVYTEYEKSLNKERERVKHLIHIEWGADSHARRHSENPDKVLANIATGHGTDERGLAYLLTGGEARVSKDGDWSESYACNLFDWHLKTQETLPWFVGSAQWIFQDFTTPKRPDNPVPRMNQKGLLERDMTKKEGYFVFQSYWAKEPMAHLYGHTWPVRWGDEGEAKMVKVYSNCASAELFLNGVSLGVKKRDSQNFPAAGLRWMTPFVKGKNQLRVVATQGKTTVTDEVDFLYQTDKWGEPDNFTLTEIARHGDVVTVEVQLFDAKKVLCLDSRMTVRFAIDGVGTLHDNLGTSTGSRVVQLYNGRAQISLTRGVGASLVTVSTPESKTVVAATLSLA